MKSDSDGPIRFLLVDPASIHLTSITETLDCSAACLAFSRFAGNGSGHEAHVHDPARMAIANDRFGPAYLPASICSSAT